MNMTPLKTIYSLSFILLGAFPILPFKMKGLVVFVFFILAVSILTKKHYKPKLFLLLNTLLFLAYTISLSYTENTTHAFKALETSSSMMFFPIIFILFSQNNDSIKRLFKNEIIFKIVFVCSSLLLSFLLLISTLKFGNIFTEKIDINKFYYSLNTNFYWMEDHPIYLSIYLATSIIIIVSLSLSVKLWIKFLLFFVGLFQLFIIIFLARKGVIMALMITLVLFCVFMIKKHTQLILFFVLTAGFFSLITVKYSPETIKRFKEVFDTKSYNQIKSYSSTSQRQGIYKCSWEKINESWLVGYGIGDTQNELIGCYKKRSNILAAGEFNSHNQFLSVLLHVGVLGFFLFLTPLIINLKLFYLKRDYFAFCLVCMYLLIMLTENILERQNGVILFSFILNFYSFKNSHLR